MRAGIVESAGRRAGLVALYLLAAHVGHASVIDGDAMALVWPAGGLAVAWLIMGLRRSCATRWAKVSISCVAESWTAELAATLASDPSDPSDPAGARETTAPMIAGIERATAHMRSLVEGLLADASARDRTATPIVVDLPALAHA